MKHFLLFLALTMLPIMAAAQRKTNLRIPQNAIFYNSNGKGVSQQREAAFYRVLAIDDKGQKMFYDYTMNGQLKAEKHYKSISKTDDKKTILHGVALVYNASGKLESIMQYSNGQAHGRAVSFFPNGNIGMKLNYRNGLLNGKSYTYSENGNLQYSTLWRNGTKVSEQRGGNDEYIDWKTGKDPFCDNNRVYEQAAMAAPKPKKQNTTAQKSQNTIKQLPQNEKKPQPTTPKVAQPPMVQPIEQPQNKAEELAKNVKYPDENNTQQIMSEAQEAVNKAKAEDKATPKKKKEKQPNPKTIENKAEAVAVAAARPINKVENQANQPATTTPSVSQSATTRPTRPKGEFSFDRLFPLLAGGEMRTNDTSFFDKFAADHGLNLSQVIKGFGAQKELSYSYNMQFDEQADKDIVTGDRPRQMGFFGVGIGNRFTIQRINLYTYSEEEMLHIAEDALAYGYKILGETNYRTTDGNFVLTHPNHNKAGDAYAITLSFTHLEGVYANLYHITLEAK